MHAVDAHFETWLLRETGIDASSLGANVLERAVAERVRIAQGGGAPTAHDHAEREIETHAAVTEGALDAYWNLLNTSPDERQALIELLVVPETWFFRDREAFIALAKLALERSIPQPSRVLRILSAPCATGEEPYSISMTLLDAGIGPARFVIDAIDISAQAIAFAQRGVYRRNSFRGNALEFRERHFSESAEHWRVNDAVRQPVRFMHANLLDLPPAAADLRYDFIFCRNVLIYFNREMQDLAIRVLAARLAEDGTIFVGAAETGLMMRHTMTSARIPMAFAFQRTTAVATAASSATQAKPAAPAQERSRAATTPHRTCAAPFIPPPPSKRGSSSELSRAARRTIRKATPDARGREPSSMKAAAEPAGRALPPSAPATLDEARRLADAGQFDDAERLAQTLARTVEPDAGVFYLLGLIADARGRSAEANEFYRKTLYLEPTHYEALAHLAVLLDAAGDTRAARHLMLRAERVMTQGDAANGQTREGGSHGPRRS